MPDFTEEEYPTADLVLTTSDGESLYVHQTVLRLASPFFQDMFDIPQPSTPELSSPTLDSRKQLSLPEDSGTMRRLLSGIYPCLPDHLTDLKYMGLGRLVHLLRVSMKYILELVTSRLTDALSERASTAPDEAFTIYAIARVLNLRNVAQKAVSSCLRCGTSDMIITFPEDLPLVVDEGSDRGSYFSVKSEAESNVAVPPVLFDRLAERESLRSILSQFSGQEYQRLLQFYRLRISEAREIIKESFRRTPSHKCPRGTCGYKEDIRSSLESRLLSEVDEHGPALERILHDHFARSAVPSSACGNCWEATINGEFMDKLRSIKNHMEASLAFQL